MVGRYLITTCVNGEAKLFSVDDLDDSTDELSSMLDTASQMEFNPVNPFEKEEEYEFAVLDTLHNKRFHIKISIGTPQ